MPEDYIADALEIVSAWDIPDDKFVDAVNSQARLMAGIHPDEFWGGLPEIMSQTHIHTLPSSNPPLLSPSTHRSVCIRHNPEDVARPRNS